MQYGPVPLGPNQSFLGFVSSSDAVSPSNNNSMGRDSGRLTEPSEDRVEVSGELKRARCAELDSWKREKGLDGADMGSGGGLSGLSSSLDGSLPQRHWDRRRGEKQEPQENRRGS